MRRHRSAVRRLALPGALVFALGSAAVLFVAYQSTVRAVDDQFDALLSSEAADLASEAAPLPPGELRAWLAREREDFLRYLELRSGEGPASPVPTRSRRWSTRHHRTGRADRMGREPPTRIRCCAPPRAPQSARWSPSTPATGPADGRTAGRARSASSSGRTAG